MATYSRRYRVEAHREFTSVRGDASNRVTTGFALGSLFEGCTPVNFWSLELVEIARDTAMRFYEVWKMLIFRLVVDDIFSSWMRRNDWLNRNFGISGPGSMSDLGISV